MNDEAIFLAYFHDTTVEALLFQNMIDRPRWEDVRINQVTLEPGHIAYVRLAVLQSDCFTIMIHTDFYSHLRQKRTNG